MTDELRRMDDQRAAELGVRLSSLETAFSARMTAVEQVVSVVPVLNERLAAFMTRVDSDVLRRVAASETHHENQDGRIDALERERDKQAGAMGFIKAVQVVLAIVTAAVALFVAIRGGVG